MGTILFSTDLVFPSGRKYIKVLTELFYNNFRNKV
jgi:hypothetical protein